MVKRVGAGRVGGGKLKWGYLLGIPLALMPLVPSVVLAQQAAPAAQTTDAGTQLSQQELEQILAPIALYPDELLTQVLVAATYPLEVVMASRWLDQPGNKNLKGDDLLKALNSQDWDPSVKSLVPFPDVLHTMSTQLDWTQRLGDAFLAQQADVFTAVQSLRGRAQSAGTLQTNAQQVISQDAGAIVIAPAQPQTVFVPVYNPSVVFGAWPYTAYPPVYWPPPPGYAFGSALATGLAFGAGIAITSSLWGWGRPNWGGGNVNVNVNRFNTINSNQFNNFQSNRVINNSGNTWQHNANHRRGVAYSNPRVNQQFRPGNGGNPGQRDAFRGRPNGGPGAGPGANRPNVPGNVQRPGGPGGPGAGGNRPNVPGNVQRPGGSGGPGAGGNRPNVPGNVQRPGGSGGPGAGGNRPNVPGNVQRPGGGGAGNRPQVQQRPGGNNGAALRGTNNGAAARAQSSQGRASRGAAAPQARPNGGGGRPGGGGGGRPGGGGGGPRGGRG